MDLYFLRHGKAFKRSPKFRPDSIRPLTPEGEELMHEVACGIKRLDIDFNVILSSPYVRAAKTAEIFHDVIKRGKLMMTKSLISEAEPLEVIHEIEEKYSRKEGIILIGHEPHMSSLMSVLLSGEANLSIDLKKSGLAKLCIDHLTPGKCACLKWMMTPQQLAYLSKD